MVRAEEFTFRGLKLLVELLFRDAPRNSLAKTANPRMAFDSASGLKGLRPRRRTP